eukprot:1172462-Lingulodinium_polyedra.AAC.1
MSLWRLVPLPLRHRRAGAGLFTPSTPVLRAFIVGLMRERVNEFANVVDGVKNGYVVGKEP